MLALKCSNDQLCCDSLETDMISYHNACTVSSFIINFIIRRNIVALINNSIG